MFGDPGHCKRLFVFEIDVDDVLKRGHTLDDFRNALKRHQEESDRQKQLHRPTQQSAGVGGGFIDRPRIQQTRAR